MRIISHRQTVETEYHIHDFRYVDDDSAGYCFDVDTAGKLLTNDYVPLANYQQCLTGIINGRKTEDWGVKTYTSCYAEPAVGLCDCGKEVTLYGFTNTCECGRDYNMSGQLLAPRCQWGEETGESLADILQIQ